MANDYNPHHHNLLPETGFVRLLQIIGNPKADPPIPAIVPISKSTLWNWVKMGRFPPPIKLSNRITVWKIEVIREYLMTTSDSDSCQIK